jgi:hypothetical protein
MDSEPKSKTGLEEYSSKTGFKERTLDPSVFDMDFFRWSKPHSPKLFERYHEPGKWLETQRRTGMWLYNRTMLTAPTT